MNCSEIILTIFSTIASGFLSWLVTFVYFKITNRNAALSSVVEGIIDIIGDDLTENSIKSMSNIINKYEFRYLKKNERITIKKLYNSLKKAKTRSELSIDIKILEKHFDEILFQNNIDKDIYLHYDITTDTEILLPPPELDRLYDSIKGVLVANFEIYNFISDNNNSDFLEKKINGVYNECLKDVLLYDQFIDFFKDISIELLLSEHSLKKEWKTNWKDFGNMKQEFEDIFKSTIKKRETLYQ